MGCCTPGGLATQGFRIWAKLHVFQINVRVSIANHGDDYISLSIYISISLFISISISFISVYICIYFYLSIYLPRSNYLPTCLPTYLPINLSISIYLFIYIICNYVIYNWLVAGSLMATYPGTTVGVGGLTLPGQARWTVVDRGGWILSRFTK